MPLYVFNCPKCGAIEEKIVKTYKEKIFCNRCGYNHSIKLPPLSNFILKKGGVGWAKEGYSK